MRIIAGKHRGRKIEAPKGKDIRPTTDRCREALFNLLMHGPFDESPVINQSALDLCCGTGALGLEAFSRGAAHVTFIDQNRKSLELAEYNVEALHEQANARFIQSDVVHLPRASEPVALIMMDAPYRSGLVSPAYDALVAKRWLKPGTILAFEQDHKESFPELENGDIITQRNYGKTRITLVEYIG